jgi:L-ribulose-5-phosphate 3-epimerase
MKSLNRREFVQAAAALAASGAVTQAAAGPDKAAGKDASGQILLGIIIDADDAEKGLARVRELGFTTCEMSVSDYSAAHAAKVKEGLAKHKVSPTALICNGPGELVWDFYQGPLTIGLVPRKYRAERVARLKEAVDFCKAAGIPAVNSHFGFIPEDPNDVLYKEFIEAAKQVAVYAVERGIKVRFETGQETPICLLRAIEDIGTGNLGVNYDTANLILYGKANPVDGLGVIGKHVQSLHAKDGTYPVNPKLLGEETPIGKGQVDFPAVIRKLKALGFQGHITIEREISGPKQTEDIKASKTYLEGLIRTA